MKARGLGYLGRYVRNAGISGACLDLLYRVLHRTTRFMALTMLSLTPDGVDPTFLSDRSEYAHRFLSGSQVTAFAHDPVNEMPEDFVFRALAKGDRCYAILDGETLASYGWYARGETSVTEDLNLHFHPEWAYMYKGFTRPEYRGQRLHAIGMARAMMEHVREGSRGVVSFVEANNFSSLKSCYRMGYEKAGTIVALKLMGRYFIRVSRGCEPLGLGLRPVGAAPAAPRGPRRSEG
jgi:hypothetical protein